MPDDAAATVELLIERSASVKRLARRLVADAHAADDLVQDAWVAALERPPRGDQPLARWFGAVLRNFARERWRTDRRREARERRVARDERSGHDDGALEKLEAHELLVAAVRSLDEPYRTAIVLRYFEELSPREIAERLGVPLRTVHTRLGRALELLRAKLDRRAGDRGAWLACLASLTQSSGGLALGALLVNCKLVIALAVVALAAATWFGASHSNRSSITVAASVPRPAALALEAPRGDSNTERTAIDDSRAPELGPSNSNASSRVAAAERVRGSVLDVDGRARSDLALEMIVGTPNPNPRTIAARSGQLGEFEFERLHAPKGWTTIRSADPRIATVFELLFADGDAAAEPLALIVAPRVELAGTVVDASERALTGARVELRPPLDLRARLRRSLERTRFVERKSASDERGAFRFSDAPAIEGASLAVELAGYDPASLALDDRAHGDLRIVLTKSAALLEGTVLGSDGLPSANTRVALGEVITETDDRGAFHLDLARAAKRRAAYDAAPELHSNGVAPSSWSKLRAVRAGFLPATLECASDSPFAVASWPTPLVLRFESAALSIRGRVVDRDGAPVAGARIALLDRERFGQTTLDAGGSSLDVGVDVESLLADDFWNDEHPCNWLGLFEIRGLQRRDYRLRAYDPRTLTMVTSAPIRAGGEPIELGFDDEPRIAKIAGVLVTPRGDPVVGVSLRLERATGELAFGRPASIGTDGRPTDAQGRFEFLNVARAATTLVAPGAIYSAPVEFELRDEKDLEHLRLVTPLGCRVQVDLRGSARAADSFELRDARDRPLTLTANHEPFTQMFERLELVDGLSEVFSVAESATTLVLFAGTKELERLVVRLDPAKLNTLRH